MSGKVMQEPGYVIHRRPWRETSLQVDAFTLNYGRVDLIARGASTSRQARQGHTDTETAAMEYRRMMVIMDVLHWLEPFPSPFMLRAYYARAISE
jgi:hypothetical protein